MTRDNRVIFPVVLIVAMLLCPGEIFSQAITGRASTGGAVLRSPFGAETVPLKITSPSAAPLPSGSYTVGTAGYFPTLDSAFGRLSGGGILGPVTLLLTDTLYVASPAHNNTFTLQGPIAGSGPASRITIRPADNVAAKIQGSGTATLTFVNVSYLTVDGINLQGSTRLTVHTLLNTSYGWNDGIDLWRNCDYAEIRNLKASTDDFVRLTSVTIALLGDAFGVPDSCLVSGVAITSGAIAIGVGGSYPTYPLRPRGNVLRGNQIGSPVDSLICRGFQIEGADGTIIEGNRVENLRLSLPDPIGDRYILGINAYFCRDAVIRNNIVHNLCADTSRTFIDGIFLTGSSSMRGANAWVYNNMVYDIRNRVPLDVDMNGIGAWSQDSARVDYNSVCLSAPGSTSAGVGSSALGFYSTASLSTARNNILVNLREERLSVALAIWFGGTNWKLSDHNDLYVGAYDSSFVAYYGGTSYKSIATLHSGGKEVHSVSVMPPFVSSQNLHLDSTHSAVRDGAIPIPGIASDIDEDTRPWGLAPDIGSDEWVPSGGVDEVGEVPGSFALMQNYPNPFNPSTTIKFELPKAAQVSLTVYDILGRVVSVLVNERRDAGVYEVKFEGSNLASGVYFYRLKAGDFVQSKKLVLLK